MRIIFEYFFIFIKKTSIATEKKTIIAKKQISKQKAECHKNACHGKFHAYLFVKIKINILICNRFHNTRVHITGFQKVKS